MTKSSNMKLKLMIKYTLTLALIGTILQACGQNSVENKQTSLRDLSVTIVYLDQKASLMHDSIIENILLGNVYDEEKFKEINEAYDALGDPDKKSQYDNRGRGYGPAEDYANPFSQQSPFYGDFADIFRERS